MDCKKDAVLDVDDGVWLLYGCRNVQYIERNGTEYFHTLKVYPEALNKKITLLKYFCNYMDEHLLKVCTLFSHKLYNGYLL